MIRNIEMFLPRYLGVIVVRPSREHVVKDLQGLERLAENNAKASRKFHADGSKASWSFLKKWALRATYIPNLRLWPKIVQTSPFSVIAP